MKNKNLREFYIYKIKKCRLKISIFLFSILFLLYLFDETIKYQQDDLTLVSAYYRIKSKHNPTKYLKWISNIVILNKSFVFFTNKAFMPTLKELRPKEFHYKTKFIELEMEEFYSYKKFYKNFKESFKIDYENRYHTIPLYLIWAEKCMFLKKAILHNYFGSKCFYWIDAGYFRNNKADMQKYINVWPSPKKCFSNKRLLMGQLRQFSKIEKNNILNFDINEYNKFNRKINVVGGLFGGQIDNTIKFIYFYYEAIRAFANKKFFIGRDQTIFTYIAFAHPEIMNLIMVKTYRDFQTILL